MTDFEVIALVIFAVSLGLIAGYAEWQGSREQ